MRILSASATAALLLGGFGTAAAAPFSYNPAGQLVGGSGSGRADKKVYVPGMRFPIESAPAFLNSQVWGVGGSQGPSGSQCDAKNFSYPWWDNYCEKRSWKMPLCPSGTGHQGQDIRATTCTKDKHWVVATVDGKITHIGGYSVYLTANDGTIHRFLHMSQVQVKVGQTIKRGTRVGKVSNVFGGTPTTVHLHFDLKRFVSGVGSVYIPPYMSLVTSYQALIGPVVPALDAKLIGQGTNAEADPDGVADYRICAGQQVRFWFELENTGSASWTDSAGSATGQSIRLGSLNDKKDPLTGQTRISLNNNANNNVVSIAAGGANCNDKPKCRRTVFVKGTGIPGKAPQSSGVVQSEWRLVDELNKWFGPTLKMSFNVVDCAGQLDASALDASRDSAGTAGNSGQKTRRALDEEGGCSCRLTTRARSPFGDLFGVLLLPFLVFVLRRTRRRPARRREMLR